MLAINNSLIFEIITIENCCQLPALVLRILHWHMQESLRDRGIIGTSTRQHNISCRTLPAPDRPTANYAAAGDVIETTASHVSR